MRLAWFSYRIARVDSDSGETMRTWMWMLLALPLLAGCQEDGSSTTGCVDEDGDGYGENCDAGDDCDDRDENNWLACSTCLDVDEDESYVGCDAYTSIAGPDCDDADVDNQTACATCVDGDGDSAFVGCDAYVSRSGPDCDDADVDNQTGCATCTDADGDSAFAGCDAYTTRSGPDCNDADVDNQTACATCLDADGDDAYVGCDAYTVRDGPDCDDSDGDAFPGAAPSDSPTACMRDADLDDWGDASAPTGGVAGTDCDDDDPDNWASCATCTDGDLDLDYAGCDRYFTIPGPDCDDNDPLRSSIEPELADDGLDNDCSGSDLVAAAEVGVFVDASHASCSDTATTRGAQTTPYCSLEVALGDGTAGGNLFVAAGTYTVRDVSRFATGAVAIYGGYDSSWNRDLATNTTRIDSTGMSNYGFLYSGPGLIVDGVDWQRTTSAGAGRDLVAQSASLSAVTRSHFDVAGGTGFSVEILGTSSAPADNDHALVRDNTFTTSAPDRFVQADGNQTFRFVGNHMVGSTTSGNHFGVIGDSRRDFFVNNTSTGGPGFYHLLTNPGAGEAYVANNSLVGLGAVSGWATSFRSESLVLINNAHHAAGNQQFFNALLLGSSTPPDMTVLNNIVETNAANFGYRQGTTGTAESFVDAAAMNACSGCIDAGGNQDADIDFVDPTNDDFRLGNASPGIDGGADPTLHVPFWRIDVDQLGASRPQDGDGLNGAQWDVGALED